MTTWPFGTDADEHDPQATPECGQHGPMEQRQPETPEQRWCGTWYQCTSFRCGSAALLPSLELRAQLAAQRAASSKAAA
ncbi:MULTISPECIES: hypothetical protein [Streptomyces]|uniref:Uncharacterized protein n=1 Tax=Streptomyces dengpaensis TaxID=2049881 RepID=A0ABN5ICC2_9ACTN|nr:MULTISPECIES: hypothetical protein [Streptomyces]AVH59992.1 hypothetical protein C4B68_34140 [Streptomyces dengpaensis]PIB09630.1 hypothetical protein B1C81_10815 [Streptomyces sp. HG99]